MPDNRDDNNDLPRQDQERTSGGAAGSGRGEDPLAELARLIDEDPFADFDRARQARAEHEPERFEDEFADEIAPPAAPPPVDAPTTGGQAGGDEDTAWHAAAADETAAWHAAEAPEPLSTGLPEEHAAAPLHGESAPYGDEPYRDQAPDVAPPWGSEGQHGDPLEPVQGDWSTPAAPEPAPSAFDPALALEAELFAGEREEPGGQPPAEQSAAAEPFEDWPDRDHRSVIRDAEPARPELPPAPTGHREPLPAAGLWAEDSSRQHWASAPVHREPGIDEIEGNGEAPMPGDAPGFGAGPPPASYADELEPEPRSRRGLVVVGSLVALVVLGGAVALGYRGLVSPPPGEPPVIRADGTPTKVMAEADDADEGESQGKLVYDRIGGTPSEREERVVSREEPVFEVAGRDQPVRQVEAGPEAAEPGRDPDDDAATITSTAVDEPRRVRTVVVRPDGTIVSPPQPPAATREAPEVPAAEPQLRAAASPADAPLAEVEAEAAGEADGETEADAASQETLAMAAEGGLTGETEPAFVPPSAEQVAAARQQQAREAPTGPRQQGRPLQLVPDGDPAGGAGPAQTAAAPAAAPTGAAAQPFPSGSYIVQVASTRSEQEARGAASAITERHGSVLGDYRTAVERADLGDRGVFYRIGVGPLGSQADANALCDRLKANGQDCFVRRN